MGFGTTTALESKGVKPSKERATEETTLTNIIIDLLINKHKKENLESIQGKTTR